MSKFALYLLCLPIVIGACTTLPADAPQEAPTPTAPGERPQPQPRAPQAAPLPPKTDGWPEQRDKLAAALASVSGITLRTAADGSLRIDIPSADGFARDSDAPRPSLTAALDRIVPHLAEHPRTTVEVLGHTDSMGSELYNLRLSIRRAEAVMEYLRVAGIPLARLSADGRGEAEPIADNASETERIKNRRVELVIRPQE